MPNTNAIDIDDLYYSAINVQSTDFNFGAGYSETWEEVWPPCLTCPTCDETFTTAVASEGDACLHCNDGTLLEWPEVSPMMNYYYKLPHYDGDPEADQLRLYQSSANVVLVQIMGGEDSDDAYVLALSGGGMDLSWDICHAYILLGYAPPVHFCDLPEFAGQERHKEPYWSILKACLQSAKALEQRAIRRKGRLLKMVNDALECPGCGHPDPHNRVGGCEYGKPVVPCWGCDNDSDDEGQHTHPEQCRCISYLEERPIDAEAVRYG